MSQGWTPGEIMALAVMLSTGRLSWMAGSPL